MKSFTNDGNKHISRDGNPYLSFYRVFRSAVECLYPQMLLDPFEEQLDLPTTLV
jgi:hypothetical protein